MENQYVVVDARTPQTGARPAKSKSRVFLTPDERNQAIVRLAVISCVVTYTGSYTWLTLSENPFSKDYFQFAIAYVGWSLFLLLWAFTLHRPPRLEPSRTPHRIVCVFSDIVGLSYGMYLGELVGAPLFPVFLWVTLGNGIRFGNPYLYGSAALSAVSFCAVAFASNAWDFPNNMATPIGLTLGLLVVPAYVGGLLTKQRETLNALEEANRAKTEFIATVNHELRTPLNGVIAVADLLALEGLDTNQHRLLAMIQSSAATQLTLVNRILDVTKLAAGEMHRIEEPFFVTSLIREVYDVIHPQVHSKPLEFTVFIDPEIDLQIVGSAEHVRQILVNLCANAVKFTEIGHVALRVQVRESTFTTQTLAFEIEDTGIGIPPDKIQRVFDPFAQADGGVSRRYGGTGLGLSIAVQLTELLSGGLTVTSEQHVGTKFELQIPLKRLPAEDRSIPLKEITVVPIGFGLSSDAFQNECSQLGIVCKPEPCYQELPHILDDSDSRDSVILVANTSNDEHEARANAVIGIIGASSLPLVTIGMNSSLTRHAISALRSWPNRQLLANALHIAHAFSTTRQGPPKEIKTDGRPLNVLLAEDNETNQAVIRMTVERAGHQVTIVSTGPQALEMLNSRTFDICLFDMHMPEMTGTEVAEICRFSPEHRDLPIILVTADTSQSARDQAKKAGITRFVSKPIRPAELLAIIHESVEGNSEQPTPPSDNRTHLRAVDGSPILDENAIRELVTLSEDPQFLPLLFDGFLSDVTAGCTEIDKGLNTGDFEVVNESAHAIKGAARAIGAPAIASRVSGLSNVDPLRLKRDGRRLLALLREDIQKTREEFSKFLITETNSQNAS